MFENLRDAFREAVDNFKQELNRDDVPEAVDRLLRGMKEEAADAQALARGLEREIEITEKISQREARDAKTCRRREEMATRIGDPETARIAAEFAKKHEDKREVLDTKADVLRRELVLRKAEVVEMIDKIKQSQQDRDALAATAGRTGARSAIQGANDLFDELDRMAEKIDDTGSEARAGEEVWRALEGEDTTETVDFDARLAELKRRMDQD
jgi:phage shock protein A